MSGRKGTVPSWRNLWQQYPCELCTAGPGDPCLSYAGRVKYEPHAVRAQVARSNGWKEEVR